MSCDNTGGYAVLLGGQSGVGDLYPRLFDLHVGDSPQRDLGCAPVEKIREEGALQSLLKRTKILSSDALDKIPLLLEGLLQTSTDCLWVSARHPGNYFHIVSPPFDLLIDT